MRHHQHQFTGLLALSLLAALVSQPDVAAQREPKAVFSAEVVPAEARRGETVELRLHGDVEAGWHLYSTKTYDSDFGPTPTAVALSGETPVEVVGELRGPEPEKKLDEGFGFEIEYYPGDIDLVLPVQIGDGADLGETEIRATVSYMACSDLTCSPPTEAEVSATLTLGEGEPRAEYVTERTGGPPPETSPPRRPAAPPTEVEEALSGGFWSFAGFAISMGLLALLTPCVFPMIPLTVSFFTGQEDRSRGQSLLMAATYALGIVVTYTVIGILLALTLGATGANQLAANPVFNLCVTLLFGAFALSMFGLFELRLPSSFVQFSTQRQGQGGLLGVLFMSLTFALVSFSCTSALVGVLLVQAAQGEWTWPALGMSLFSAAMALPFFFLALFPRALESLPKSGEWMEAVKVVMGFLLIAAATKFLSNVDASWGWGLLTRPVVLATWICSFGLAGAYLLGKINLAGHGAPEGIGPVRLLVSVLFLSFALYLCAGLAGRPLYGWLSSYLPAEEAVVLTARASPQAERRQWFSDYATALTEAKRTGKPLFVDFSGKTCTNCRWMEANIFPHPQVAELLNEFVLVRLMTDLGAGARENRELQTDRFGTTALPLYVILTPEEEEVARSAGLTRKLGEFVRFLRSGLGAAGESAAA